MALGWIGGLLGTVLLAPAPVSPQSPTQRPEAVPEAPVPGAPTAVVPQRPSASGVVVRPSASSAPAGQPSAAPSLPPTTVNAPPRSPVVSLDQAAAGIGGVGTADGSGPMLLPPDTRFGTIALRGVAFNERDKSPTTGLRVGLSCEECAVQQRWTVTRDGGRFDFMGLPAGEYTLVVHGPGGPVIRALELAENEGERIVAVPHERGPRYVKDDKGRIVYRGWSGNAEVRRTQMLMGTGGVLIVGAIGMAVGAVIEGTHPQCRFSSESGTCDAAPRRGVAGGLAVAGLVAGAVGGTLFGIGALQRFQRRVKITAGLGTLAARF